MAKSYPTDKWTFMNYGYSYPDKTDSIALDEDSEINRYSIQLYHNLINKVDFKSKSILEVGSGRGGGSNYIASLLSSGEITGMDLAEESVAFCNRTYNNEKLNYIVGNSESIPFSDDSVDIVINVESSHAYGSVDKFLKEVRRVLRNSGYFLLTDFRDPEGFRLLEKQLADCDLELISTTNITDNVIKAIEEEDEVKRKRIREHIPGRLSGIFSQFAGVIGSKVHTNLSNGKLIYYQFILKK